jgi:hypothetical protein
MCVIVSVKACMRYAACTRISRRSTDEMLVCATMITYMYVHAHVMLCSCMYVSICVLQMRAYTQRASSLDASLAVGGLATHAHTATMGTSHVLGMSCNQHEVYQYSVSQVYAHSCSMSAVYLNTCRCIHVLPLYYTSARTHIRASVMQCTSLDCHCIIASRICG